MSLLESETAAPSRLPPRWLSEVESGQRPPHAVVAQTSPDRVDLSKNLSLRRGASEVFAISHMRRKAGGHGMTDAHSRIDGYVACVHLEPFNDFDIWCDKSPRSSVAVGAGAVHINDLRHAWQMNIRGPFHVVNVFVSQQLLDDISAEGDSSARELSCSMASGSKDPVLMNLALALLPALEKPEHVNRLFLEHAAVASTAHLARTFGSGVLECCRGGLAPWQVARAKEALRADLTGNISLARLAATCRLSPSHFSQAFKQTVGCPPHQWLMGQRVDQAKQLMLNTSLPLSEVALESGFADQSHFTRVFTHRIRVSPGAWRRTQRR